MSSGLFSTHDSHTLLVDLDVVHGQQLLEQLNRAGCRSYFAASWRAAHIALAENLYDSCIVVAHLERSEDLDHLDQLRRAVQTVWIIVLSDLEPEKAGASPTVKTNTSAPGSRWLDVAMLAVFIIPPMTPGEHS
jgi:PleD family two-component response regulator